MTLKQYRAKRNFSKTPEPKGQTNKKTANLYIIQKHAASHLHYDFRLELNGVLLSWAVPKGPSLDPTVKRLAMHVEDHPVAYGAFEGIIPKGQYGGGTVMLWDKGSWHSLDDDATAAYKKGHLRFELTAEKLNGRWDLIRFKDDKHWFLIKYKDEFADAKKDITQSDKSVLTNQSMEKIAKNYSKVWQSKAKSKTSHQGLNVPQNLTATPFPDFFKPQLATLVDKPPQGAKWLHEVKFDGYRIITYKNGNDVLLKSRNNKDWTGDLTSVATAIKQLTAKNLILDGEVVLLDEQGKSDFQLLQNAIKNDANAPFIYYIFDILYYDRFDLRELALIERKALLKELLNSDSPTLFYSDHIVDSGLETFEQSCELALEGIISKQVDSTYYSGRSKSWLKVKCLQRQEFIIGGYSPPKGQRGHFGSLFLGVNDKDGNLVYAGNVGTGFSQASLREIFAVLQKNKSAKNPFTTKPPGANSAQWVVPKIVAEVEFSQWTDEGHLRHSSFKGLRMDKKAVDVLREEEFSVKKITQEHSPNQIILTHPDKIIFAEDNISKEDLLSYYEIVADYMLPYIANRPLTLVRCPGNYSKCFYQRHFNKGTPKELQSVDVTSDDGTEEYIFLNNKEGLLSLVQWGVLEIHPWGSSINHLEQPDILIFDLDPAPDVTWAQVVKAALEVREYLSQYHLESFVKTTGGKGLHVVIPIKPEHDWLEVKEFSQIFVQLLEQIKPQDYIGKMTKAKRTGKIFIDYLRNQRTATAIGAYSTRARLHAPVATPLAWDELSDNKEDNSFTIKTLPARLAQLKHDPWENFWKIKQSLVIDSD